MESKVLANRLRLPFSVCAGCFALIFAVRLHLVAVAGFAHPYWDQWGFEGTTIVEPFLEGKLTLADLFTAESEHRNVFPRLTQLALVGIDGGFWDGLAQAVMNIGLFAFFGTIVVSQLFRLATGLERWLLPILLLAAFCSPVGFQNTLWGICSSWYFLIFCSLFSIIAVSESPPFSARWFFGLAAAVAAFLGMAGGIITPVICAGITFVRWLQLRKDFKAHWLAIMAWLALAVGFFAVTPRVPGNQLAAKGAWEFCTAVLDNLAFPFTGKLFSITTIAVIALLGTAVLLPRSRARWKSGDFAILGILFWLLGQVCALAYGRGHGGIPHRYHELLVLFGPFVIAAFAILPRLFSMGKAFAVSSHILLAGLLLTFLVGLTRRTTEAFSLLIPQRTAVFAVQEANLRSFVQTDDVEGFRKLSPDQTGSYQGADVMSRIMRTPALRAALAPSIREPVSIAQQDAGGRTIEPVTAEALNTLKLPAPRVGRYYSVMVQTLIQPTIRDRIRGLSHGLILRPTPLPDSSHSIEVLTSDPRRLQHSAILKKLGATSFFLPRGLGPIGWLMRIMLAFSSLLLVLAVSGFAAVALAAVWSFSRATQRSSRRIPG
jgi:hypothetical protein